MENNVAEKELTWLEWGDDVFGILRPSASAFPHAFLLRPSITS
jgi:hypothetical protein